MKVVCELTLLPALVLAMSMSAHGSPKPPVSSGAPTMREADARTPRTRYSFANRCAALRSLATGHFVRRDGAGYSADASAIAQAEPFFLKPSALGEYLLFSRSSQLLTAGSPLTSAGLSEASDAAIWALRGVGDDTVYPPAPQVDVEPTPTALHAYRDFEDPNHLATQFTLASNAGKLLATDEQANLQVAVANGSERERFALVEASGCAQFPEIGTNTQGDTFKGTLPDGRVLGFYDAHTHVTAGGAAGGALHGRSFHKFGVTHALGDCAVSHGRRGLRDLLFTLASRTIGHPSIDHGLIGHATDGWPTFSAWPSPASLTHNADYWRWLERAWMAGLRLIVNLTVAHETFCELLRHVYPRGGDVATCNEMDNALAQVGTSYAMQDYIDAQYGGRGAGFWRIVESPAEARRVIADGKMAVILGIEDPHAFNCNVTYRRPQGIKTPEDANIYGCSTDETAPNALVKQVDRAYDLGIRSVYPTHHFDNAFAGGGIFTPTLNLFNRVDTGEFFTTYDCPSPDDPRVGGYLFHPGANLAAIPPILPQSLCLRADADGLPGGKLGCYPADEARPQCNARWLTPTGLYLLEKLMQRGIIVELDHMELEVKSQVLDLAEAQSPVYPTSSAHSGDPLSDGQFIAHGGMSNVQARRILAGGGIIAPMKRNAPRFIQLHQQIKKLYEESGSRHMFAFSYAADSAILALQPIARERIEPGKEVVYPFTLFKGPVFDDIPEFKNVAPVTFDVSSARDQDGRGREWRIDKDGQAHNGLFADGVEELRQEGDAEVMRDLYLSAESYLQMWERTQAAGRGVAKKGLVVPDGLLRSPPAP